MNIATFKATLPTLLKHNIVPFVWGPQGVGKTQTVSQIAKELEVGFVHLHLATQEVGDLVGLLVHKPDNTVAHARPEWFPTEGKGIIFLDELNRAHPDVIQAMFSFITSKTIHTHKLPDGWKIVAAGNYANESFTVTDTSDAAWMSRFCHIHFVPSPEEFCIHAEKRGADTVADFITAQPQMLEQKIKSQHDLGVTPDRRSWLEMIGSLEKEDLKDEVRYELYAGILGDIAAAAFVTHKKTVSKSIKLKSIMADYTKVRAQVMEVANGKDTRFDVLSQPLDELVAKVTDAPDLLTDSMVANLHEFMLDIPLELLSQVVKKLSGLQFTNKNRLLSDKAFMAKLDRKL
jgi:hypothetical protein